VRRLPAVLALIGCIVHAMVLPWWLASRLPVHWTADTLGADLLVICHNGAATTAQEDLPQRAPHDPSSDCQICKGLIGLQFAILVAAQAGLLERVAEAQPSWLSSVELRDTVLRAPRNRGPPSFI
jgi:hypothetical protein